VAGGGEGDVAALQARLAVAQEKLEGVSGKLRYKRAMVKLAVLAERRKGKTVAAAQPVEELGDTEEEGEEEEGVSAVLGAPKLSATAAAASVTAAAAAAAAAAASSASDAPVDEEDMCAVCRCALNNPSILPCSHMFCSDPCLKFLISKSAFVAGLKCPVCKERFTPSDIFSVDPHCEGREKSIELLAATLHPAGLGGGSSASASASGRAGYGVPTTVPSTERVTGVPLPDSLARTLGSKVAALLRRLACLPAEDKSIVVCASARGLEGVRSGCRALGIGCAMLAGSASSRADTVARFSEGGAALRVLLLVTGTDCAGLTLTAASHLFLLDQVVLQNTHVQLCARLARLGQVKPVFIYHLVSFPVDEAMLRAREGAAEKGSAAQGSGVSVSIDARLCSAEETLALLEDAVRVRCAQL